MIAQCALHCIVKEGLYGSTEALGAGNAGDHPAGGPPGYIKWGCDATVYDGFPDFIFANNTDYPIKVVTYWNDNNVTVEILGTKVDDSYVEMVSETVDVIPWETVYEETDELAPGEKQEVQTPYTGYVVQTWRNVYAGDGSLLSSTFEATSNYESRDQIIRIGKAKP